MWKGDAFDEWPQPGQFVAQTAQNESPFDVFYKWRFLLAKLDQ